MESPQIKYQQQAVRNSSPVELIGKLYDFAIQACHKKEKEKVRESLSLLIKSLNFEYEISSDLYGLYEYCQRQAEKDNFEEICELIGPVRETWNESVVNGEQQTDNTGGRGLVV
jgi:flagellin-specific chaperone FliS